MPDLAAIRRAIDERTSELERALEARLAEIDLLTSLLEIVDSPGARAADPRAPKDSRALKESRAPKDAPAPKERGRPPSAGGDRRRPAGRRATRAEQAVHLIGEHPGITAGELARMMEMNPQYIYRLLPKLAKAGSIVRRDGWGYELAGAAGDVEFTGLWSAGSGPPSPASDLSRRVGGGGPIAGGVLPSRDPT